MIHGEDSEKGQGIGMMERDVRVREREQSLPAVDVGTVVMARYVDTILTDEEYQSLLSRTLQLAALTFIPE